jgi:DNA-binding CsgD family transcriptional regulator
MKDDDKTKEQLLGELLELRRLTAALSKKVEEQQKDSATQFITERYARTVFNSLSAHIAILNHNGLIIETNKAWKDFARANGLQIQWDSINSNYLQICDSAQGESSDNSEEVARGIRALIAGEIDEFVIDYPCHSPEEKRWFNMRAVRVTGRDPPQILVSHENITPLKMAEEALRQREHELEVKTQNLEDANAALKVLLKQRDEDKRELEEVFLRNIRELVLPNLEKVQQFVSGSYGKTLLEIVESRLSNITSPFLQRLSNVQSLLTPQEIQVAVLIKEGKTSKEIAQILHVSLTTIQFHRRNLRNKLDLKRTKTNLRSHLLSLKN